MRQLYVYMNDLKAGVLTENTPGKEYTFCYDENYLSTEKPFHFCHSSQKRGIL